MSDASKTVSNQVNAAKRISAGSFDALPDSAFIRESKLVQSPKRPDAQPILPFSAPTLWRKVKNGSFPKPHRLSDRVTAWQVGAVRQWLAEQVAE